jgi:hypothetical protein
MERDRDAMVKSSLSDEWYRVGTCMFLTAFRVMTVFMEPGGPATMVMLPLRIVIFFSAKMGHGSGRGSPAETPRFTVRARVFNA